MSGTTDPLRTPMLVALLRGVNVNGITVTSDALVDVFEGLGYRDVRTVLASGNVVFSAEGSVAGGPPEAVAVDGDEGSSVAETMLAATKSAIEGALRDRFGYDAWIVLVRQDAVAAVVDAFPFPVVGDRQPYVVFVSEPSVLDELLADMSPANLAGAGRAADWLQAGDGVVYWNCPKGASTSTPFAKRLAATRFKPMTTTRNLNTLRRLR